MDDEEFDAWFRLAHTPGFGREAARALLRACGSAVSAAAAPEARVREVAGARAARAWVATPLADLGQRLQAARRWLESADADTPRQVVALGDPRYPALLLQAADPPLLLYVQGRLSALGQAEDSDCLAVVGSRSPTPQGRAHARRFSRAFGEAGFTVVSGLAQGIDAAAHEGALASPSPTVAVVGTGLDRVFPASHADLARRIGAQGALVSEYAPGTPAVAAHFPQRNRIIAGLTRGTLVVEATLRSGSLITARLAAECGREVFAIPGSIDAPQSRGCHALIRQGAKLVESPEEVLEEWRTGPSTAPAPHGGTAPAQPRADPPDDPLMRALGFEPVDLDTLVLRTGRPAPALAAELLELELDGHVSRLPGGLFQRCARA